jgi:hypothetical protein
LLAADDEVRSLLRASDGLCRRHTAAAMRLGGVGAQHVREHTVRAMADLIRHLDEVIRKEDYRFREEPRTDEERVAPANAVAWAAGIEGLVDG